MLRRSLQGCARSRLCALLAVVMLPAAAQGMADAMAMWNEGTSASMRMLNRGKRAPVDMWSTSANGERHARCEHSGQGACASAGQTAAPDTCSFSCPAPLVLRPRPNFRSGSNGCGSGVATLSARVLPPRMTRCCDAHDGCYDVCGKTKAACDQEFRTCLDDTCAEQTDLLHVALPEICTVAGDALILAVGSFGCPAYVASQQSACRCEV